jgi:cytochrome P450
MLTFLGGPRSCIGFRLSLIESVTFSLGSATALTELFRMKIILHVIISKFEFRLAVDPSHVGKKTGTVTQRPVIKGREAEGPQLPVLVRVV